MPFSIKLKSIMGSYYSIALDVFNINIYDFKLITFNFLYLTCIKYILKLVFCQALKALVLLTIHLRLRY